MKGSTVKRCGCAPEYDAKGRRKACPKRHGSWSYVIDVGNDPTTGKRKQLRKSGFRTQAEAATAMAEVMGEVDQGRYRHDGRQTVREYLEAYLEQRSADYRPTTLANTRRWLAATYPYIGSLRLRDLQTSHISEMNRKMTAANAARGVGTSTTRRIHNALSAALSAARREQLIRSNPAHDAWRPAEGRAKVNPWTGDELGAFLDAAAAHRHGAIFELIAMTGLRRGEALGLRWSDVDLVAGHLVVRQQLVAVELEEDLPCRACGQLHKGLIFGPPKTRTGEDAIVDLGQAAIGVLMEHRLRQDADRVEWGDAYADHGLVFADVDGNPWRPDHVTKAFVKIAESNGLRRIRLHDLRHGRASLMLAAGVDIAIVSKVLRHSSIRTTADTYSHLLAGVGKSAAEAADQLIVRVSPGHQGALLEVDAAIDELAHRIARPGADVAALAAQIAALQDRRTALITAAERLRDQSVTSRASETVEALPEDSRKGPLTSDFFGGAEGTRTPDPLHAIEPNPLPERDAG